MSQNKKASQTQFVVSFARFSRLRMLALRDAVINNVNGRQRVSNCYQYMLCVTIICGIFFVVVVVFARTTTIFPPASHIPSVTNHIRHFDTCINSNTHTSNLVTSREREKKIVTNSKKTESLFY